MEYTFRQISENILIGPYLNAILVFLIFQDWRYPIILTVEAS